ncbi:hypothetical protein ACFX1R_002215 [Malus domestica]
MECLNRRLGAHKNQGFESLLSENSDPKKYTFFESLSSSVRFTVFRNSQVNLFSRIFMVFIRSEKLAKP